MLGKFYYPVIFLFEDDGITVTFPDFDYLVTSGETIEQAYEKAEECLGMGISDYLDAGKDVPKASDLASIELDMNQKIAIVSVNMKDWIQMYDSKSVRRNITLPNWLDKLAKKEGLNVSGICQRALMDELNIKHI